MKNNTSEKYTYRVEWSEEDKLHIARCLEFPSLAAHGKTAEVALKEIKKAVEKVIVWMLEASEVVPEPYSLKRHKGNLTGLQSIIRNSPVKLYEGRYAVTKCNELPALDYIFMLSNDGDEITAILEEKNLKNISYEKAEKWFKIISVNVSTPFLGVGLLAEISAKIAEKGINIFIVSTFSKDFILLREDDAEEGIKILKEIGFPEI